MLKKNAIWLIILPLIFLSTKCQTDGYQIPYVRVDLHLNIVSELGNPALDSYTLVNGGVGGLIIYRDAYDEFHAYDRLCTEYPDHTESVEADTTIIGVFTCPECKSKYLLLTNGDPIEGPATFGLHEYYTVADRDLLHVYN